MKEHGKGILFLLAIAILLLSLACSTPPPAPSRTAQEVIRLKQEPPTQGVDLFLVIDESGSMYGEKGTDPQGLRYEASKYLLQNLLVKKADRRFPHRISLIHFGDRAIAQPLTDLIPANAADLAQRVPHAGGGLGDTSFIEALRKVREVGTGTSPDRNRRKKVAVLFTDGEPDDRRRLRQEQYFQEIGDFIRSHLQGFQLYVIGIDRAPERTHWGRSQEAWQREIGPQNVLFIAEMRELYARYNEVVRQIFELPEVSPDLVTPEERAFEVQPYLEELELHIFPESQELELGIRGPDGTPLKVDGRRVLLTHGPGYDILKVLDPRPGPWRYRVAKGGGRILVLRNPIPFKLQLLEPEEVHPLGKPMRLRATFTRERGGEIREDPRYPLAFTAKVITPKREELNLQFLRERKLGEVHYADRPVPVQSPGPYTIQLTVRGGARFRTTSTHQIFVHSFPYLEPLRPTSLGRYPLSDGLGVELVLKRDHAPTDPEREFEEHPNNLILAQLLPSPGSSAADSPAIWLDRQGNRSTFRGTIRHPFRQAGLYSVAFQLVGTPRIGDQLRPPALIERVDFWVQPSWGQQLLRWLLILLAATLAVALIWGASLALWLARSPKTMAQLEIRRDGESVFTRYMNAGWLGPMRTPDPGSGLGQSPGSGPGQAQGVPALTFWVRAQGPDRLCMIRGGTLSLLTFGCFSRRVLAQRNEETDLDADHRVIFN